MSGDRRKRKQALERMISALVCKREEFRREKKTGAGSATEAIEFYQFVLDKNLLWKAKAGKKTIKVDSTVVPVSNDDFLNEHNDLCEVCGTGGELLCCNTCNLVFHLKCVRPALKTMPPDSWNCAHCDATGVTGMKKENRQRKRAITAIREMNMLTESVKKVGDLNAVPVKKEEEEGKIGALAESNTDNNNDNNDDNETCKVCSNGGDLFTCSQSVCNNSFHIPCVRPALESKPGKDFNCAYCDVDFVTGLKPQARKRRAAISGVRAMEKLKIEFDSNKKSGNNINISSTCTPHKRKLEELSEPPTPTHPGQPRSQRLRRQIIIQGEKEKVTSPDSNSESPPVEKAIAPSAVPRFSREDIPSELIKKLSRRVTNSNSRHGQYNCKFCMDDEAAELCCFCACRVCFTKHNKPDSTILCDLCDGEYHIHCLSPPLTEIPSFDWYCPTCTETIANEKANAAKSGSRTSTSKKKKKGKKSASKTVVKKGATKAKAKLLLKQQKAAYSAQQPRTTAGRFASKGGKSHSTKAGASGSKVGKSTLAPVIKRGPGRPPKSAKKAAMAQRSSPAKKSTSSATKKPMFSSSGGMVPTVTQQRSRSGRVVKRKAAYDEREEGAQLLKGTSHSISEAIEDGSSATKGNFGSKGMPSAVAMLAANAAASVIQKQQSSSYDKKKNLSASQELPAHQQAPVRGPLATSPNTLVLQHIQPVTLSGEEPLPSPRSNLSKKFTSPGGVESGSQPGSSSKNPRRKPGARECMQISRRFGAGIIQQNYMDILTVSSSFGSIWVWHSHRITPLSDPHNCVAFRRIIALGGKLSI